MSTTDDRRRPVPSPESPVQATQDGDTFVLFNEENPVAWLSTHSENAVDLEVWA